MTGAQAGRPRTPVDLTWCVFSHRTTGEGQFAFCLPSSTVLYFNITINEVVLFCRLSVSSSQVITRCVPDNVWDIQVGVLLLVYVMCSVIWHKFKLVKLFLLNTYFYRTYIII